MYHWDTLSRLGGPIPDTYLSPTQGCLNIRGKTIIAPLKKSFSLTKMAQHEFIMATTEYKTKIVVGWCILLVLAGMISSLTTPFEQLQASHSAVHVQNCSDLIFKSEI